VTFRPGETENETAPGGASSARARWIDGHPFAAAALVLAAFAAYANSLDGAFLFDDQPWIVENPLIRDLRSFFVEWSGYRKQPNRYVGHLTLALNYQLGQLDVTGYHVVNVCIHAMNALLTYALTVLVFQTPLLKGSRLARWARPTGLLAATLFVAHPIQTQAVSYVVQRYTSLSSTFYLLTVVQYVRWRVRQPSNPGATRAALRYAGILATTLLAMKTKESTFTLPFALVACELFLFPISRRGLARLAPLLVTLPVIPATKLNLNLAAPVQALAEQVQDVTVVESTLSRSDYFKTQLSAIVDYLGLLLWPVEQNVDHDYPTFRSFSEPKVLASALVIALLGAAAVYLFVRSTPGRRRGLDASARLVSFAIVWFFLALSVESSLIPIADVFVEHRVYLPSVGFFLAVAVGVVCLADRWVPAHAARVARAGALVLALALGVLTFRRNEVWADGVTLWSDAVAKSPDKARPQYNLGQALVASGDLKGAIRHYQRAVEVDPGWVRAYNNLGATLEAAGRYDEAIPALERAIRLDPTHEEAHYNLGRVYLSSGKHPEEAAALFAAALRLRTNWPEAYANMAAALNSARRFEDTVRLLNGASDVVRDNAEAHFNLGVAHVALGDREAALAEVRSLQRLRPGLARQLAEFMER
jgi:tetratricopeptide (TPR) repeat protein